MQDERSVLSVFDDGARRGEKTIGDLSRLYNVSLRTLRFYEDKGLLQPRRHGTARFYSPQDRIRLELILKGKRLGFTLAEIRELIAARKRESSDTDDGDLTVSLGREQIATQITHLERQRAELDSAILELKTAYIRMGEAVA